MGYASDNRSRFEVRSEGRGRYGGGGGGRSEGRGYGGGRGGYGGGRGGFGGGRDRERRPLEMHEATCAKCGKQCEVPFKPTGNKPVYCRDCFNKDGDSGGRDFGSRNRYGGGGDRGPSQSGGVSSAQLNEINKKLDKIIKALAIDSEEDEKDEDEDLDEE